VGLLPLELQAKFLKVLENRVIHRLGGVEEIPTNARIIAATNESPSRDGLPDNVQAQAAQRVLEFSSGASSLLKGIAIAAGHIDLGTLLRLTGLDRQNYNEARDEIKDVFPVFSTSETKLEPIASPGFLKAVRDGATQTERAAWSHRIASHLAESGLSVHLDEIHDLEGLSKLTDAYLTSGSHRKARAAAQEVIRQAQSRGEMRSRRKATGVAWVCARKHGNSEDANSLFDDVLEISDALEDEDEGKDVGRHRRPGRCHQA